MTIRIASLGVLGLIACGDGGGGPNGETAVAYVQMGGDTHRVIELGLDSETYRELTASFETVEGVTDRGPSASGKREIKLRLDPQAPAPMFEFLLTSWQSAPVGTIAHHTSFGVLLGSGGGSQAIGLLLPAVQKFNGADIEEDGSMSIEIAGDGVIQPFDPVQENASGVNVAAGDVNGFVSGDGVGQLIATTVTAPPRFTAAGVELEAGAIRLARPAAGTPGWFDFESPVALAVDIRQPDGAVLHRFRIEGALPQPDDGLDITLKPARAIYMKVKDIQGETTDPKDAAAFVATNYMAFVDRAYVIASGPLQGYLDLVSAADAPSFEQTQTYWAAERAATIEAFGKAVAHAQEHESLYCQAALPISATLAIEIAKKPLDLAAAATVATVAEAIAAMPAPSMTANAAPACRAVAELVPFVDGLVAAGGVPAIKAGTLNQAANLPSPRSLQRELDAWVALLDSIVDGTAVDNNAARAAAKAKADLLLESLTTHAEAAEARFELAHIVVAP